MAETLLSRLSREFMERTLLDAEIVVWAFCTRGEFGILPPETCLFSGEAATDPGPDTGAETADDVW